MVDFRLFLFINVLVLMFLVMVGFVLIYDDVRNGISQVLVIVVNIVMLVLEWVLLFFVSNG